MASVRVHLELVRAIENAKIAVVVLSQNYASSSWCLDELAAIVACMEKNKVLPIFYHVDPRDVRVQTGDFAVASAAHEERFRDSTNVSLWRDALSEAANISGWAFNYGDPESQLIPEFIETISNQVLEDGSTNWNLPPRFDVTPSESDDADEMVQDYVADFQLEDHEVEDHVANLPQEAHVVEDHVANLQQACTICFANPMNMAFPCGHMTCVDCGERLDKCHICRRPISDRDRIRLFSG